MVKKKRKKRSKKQAQKASLRKQDRGFDFGFQPKVMTIPDTEFNRELVDSKVIGCAYGYHPLEGIPGRVPSITLIGTNSAAFSRAYEHFTQWGCEDDGDVVDASILLKSDGSYDLWIGPEFKRSIYRTIPKSALFNLMSMNMSWIKHIDSTNVFIHDLKEYCQSSRLHPVLIMAATCSENDIRTMQQEPIPVPNWKGLLKFGLRILTEAEAALDPIFGFKEKPANQKEVPTTVTPEDLCACRIRTINTAFPVSNERILRSSLFEQVQKMTGFENVSKTQVSQAAINIMLSNELTPGDNHYKQVTGDYCKKIWNAIADKSDIADGSPLPSTLNPTVIAHQIELDVWSTLKKMKQKCERKPFTNLQEVFRQRGYIND